MRLPDAFTTRMKQLLGGDFADFLASYEKPRYFGLRVNTLKIKVEDFLAVSPFKLSPIPWVENGFYYAETDRPAKHPYYHAGLYYLQEPSAMAPAAILEAKPQDRVLDLCAAPGGKSTQIISGLQHQGLLVSNDVSGERIKALAKNLELFGARNTVITNETPERLASKFPDYFHKILIDAPCSGEGMFRKDPDAVRQWAIHSITRCTTLQRDILFHAAKMLAPGGRIVYSTCTFAPEENEGMIGEFLDKNPDFGVINIPANFGFAAGEPNWAGGNPTLSGTVRLWPHKMAGEGHFVALLEKRDTGVTTLFSRKTESNRKKLQDYYRFVEENLTRQPEGEFELYGDHLYLSPPGLPALAGVRVVKPGLYLGMLKKGRFEPSHALSLAYGREAFARVVNYGAEDAEVVSYLKGETLNITGPEGWTVVCVDGFPLGWGKQVGSMLKNHYPKGWRRID